MCEVHNLNTPHYCLKQNCVVLNEITGMVVRGYNELIMSQGDSSTFHLSEARKFVSPNLESVQVAESLVKVIDENILLALVTIPPFVLGPHLQKISSQLSSVC